MESDVTADINVCNLFEGLLVPPPTPDDVIGIEASNARWPHHRSFVVNRVAGRGLCTKLQPHHFLALSWPVQEQILCLMEEGLRAGVCSTVRLRISCETSRLVWTLLELLKSFSSSADEKWDKSNMIKVLGRILGFVCSAGIEVDELKGLLCELGVPSLISPPLVEALAVMAPSGTTFTWKGFPRPAQVVKKPPAIRRMFNFDGQGAGLVLPTMVHWPFEQEYQIAAWVRVEPRVGLTPSVTRGMAKRKAHLATFVSKLGAGFDYYLKGSHLFVEVADGKGRGNFQPRVVDIGEVGLVSGRWHALVIWHRRSSALLFNKDKLEVFIDDDLVFSASVPYPRHMTEPLTQCRIGWNFDGQTSGVLIFSGSAELITVRSMLARLASHVDASSGEVFGDRSSVLDPDLWDDPSTISSHERLKRKLFGSECRIFAALLPGRTINGQCLEPHNGHHALLRGNSTHAWIIHTAQDIVRSIGGSPILISLAHQLLSGGSETPAPRAGPNSFIGQNLDTVLSVLHSFLDGNVLNQSDFFLAGGVEVLELLLCSSPRRNFALAGVHTVMVLDGIFQASRLHEVLITNNQGPSEEPENGRHIPVGACSLENQVLVSLLTNFSLWVNAPPEFQFGLAVSVLAMVQKSPERFRQIVPVETILTSIRACCLDQISGDTSQTLVNGVVDALGIGNGTIKSCEENSEAASSTHRDWTNMARKEKLHMRGLLWEVVQLLLGPEDGDVLVQFLASCDDTQLVCELVQILGSLMRQRVPPIGLFRALENASLVWQRTGHEPRANPETSTAPATGFLALLLQRCVLTDGASEDLRVAGLRAANVFMARSAKANELDAKRAGGKVIELRALQDSESGVGATGFVKLSDRMHTKVSSAFLLLSRGLMRDRHILGELTYAALLEMALLEDECEVPWHEQLCALSIVNAWSSKSERQTSSDFQPEEGTHARGGNAEDEELIASVWWKCDSQGAGSDRRAAQVLDDAQLIRNSLPLALILRYLPTMAKSVQVRSHGDLLLMLKLNEANRHKVIELSHADGDRFWGVWERCLFLMMAPLFSRRVDGIQTELAEQESKVYGGERKGDSFMVLKLYAILLEHTMSSDDEGYKEVALVTSLKPLIPHGRIAVRVLLAQLAFEVGQKFPSLKQKEDLPPLVFSPESPLGYSRDSPNAYGEQVEMKQQPRWKNMIHLAFIAANVVSDDVSTITAGLFPEGEDIVKSEDLGGDHMGFDLDKDMQASAASITIPFHLCSNPAEDGSLALSARVLGMFRVLSSGSPSVLKLCAARTTIPDQGLLMFPLLRLSLFLLVRLHPFSRPAHENVSRLNVLVQCLLGEGWRLSSADHSESGDDMCIVILAHVHAALRRLKSQAMTVGGIFYEAISDARRAVAGEAVSDSFVPSSSINAIIACKVGNTLLGLLRCLTRLRLDLLTRRLGELLTSALQDAINFQAEDTDNFPESESATHPGERGSDKARRGWARLLQSLQWTENSFLFKFPKYSTRGASHGVSALLEACMPSLKAAEEQESRAVRAGEKRVQQWQELVNRTAVASASGKGGFHEPGDPANQVVEALKQEVLKVRAMKTRECRLLDSRRRLRQCLRTFSAAWSPWSAGNAQRGGNEPPGWEVSSHKDQLMRQMLLVPIDRDVGHKDASYAETVGGNGSDAGLPRDDALSDALIFSALKPSASLLAGEVGFVDDDEEEGGSAETGPRSHLVAPLKEAEVVPTESTSSGVGGGRSFQGLRGKWKVTNVLRQGSVPGTLYLFEDTLVFQSEPDAMELNDEANVDRPIQLTGKIWRWRLERLTQLHLRRFLLSPKAVEIFWADSPEVFLAFRDVNDRQAFTRHLREQNLSMLPVTTQRGILHPRKVLKASRLTELWRRRQISNFQYIMELNVVAGRSYNDISQYPVFPWVLSDYTSSKLDLNDPSCFRDLSKPMGALNKQRRDSFLERYTSFEDDMIPKFMYGTHYSSAGFVLHYLVRQDPFTTLHVNLQDGRFDCPDRLFNNLRQSWEGCTEENNLSDVKELTPEFFYFPEMFLNSNNLPLGDMQGGRTVGDVQLPPWAKDAFDFVRIHRLALESEQVSQNLHHWIDLIFGYKQRGNEAVKAVNVFYYLTYEGAVDLSQENDAHEREAREAQIRHFGQTPSQLLMEPHPVRLPPEECILPLFSPSSSLESLRVFSPKHRPSSSCYAAALLVYCTDDRLVCVDSSLRVTTWAWSGLPNGQGLPFTLGPCRSNILPSSSLHMSKLSAQTFLPSPRSPSTSSPSYIVGDLFTFSESLPLDGEGSPWLSNSTRRRAALEELAAHTEVSEEAPPLVVPAPSIGRVHSWFGVHTASEGAPESILSCGYWDNVVRLHYLDSTVKLPLGGSGTGGHRDAITCLAIAAGGSLLVTGGQDTTCRVWVVGNAPLASALGGRGACQTETTSGRSSGDSMVCVNVLYGHEARVTCLAVSEELDVVVSGASDGRIVLHSLKDGCYLRQYHCSPSATNNVRGLSQEVSQLAISCHGDVAAHSWTDLSLHRFSLNGTRLATSVSPKAMSCLITAGGGEYLLAGGQDGLIRVYTIHDLYIVHEINLQDHGGVTCLRLSPNDEYLLAGSEDGEVSIITDPRTRLRMLDQALRRAFVG